MGAPKFEGPVCSDWASVVIYQPIFTRLTAAGAEFDALQVPCIMLGGNYSGKNLGAEKRDFFDLAKF